MSHDIMSIGRNFQILGDFVTAAGYGTGHINDTYAAVYDQGGTRTRYLFQRINHRIFKDPLGLMDNVSRVCAHAQQKLAEAGVADASRRALTLVKTLDNAPCYQDQQGNTWRVYIFIENAMGHDIIESPAQAYEAARAFGAFQGLLVDLPGESLHQTIPDFHNTRKRYAAFEAALAADAENRAALARPEIDWALAHSHLAGALLELVESGEVPERQVTHNDTKLNNVLLDNDTDEAICVIDLDTLMPGLALYDFGDLVRTSTSPVAEDEEDAAAVTMQMHMFEALARGYLAAAGGFLTPGERKALPLAGKVITFECGIRFLADFLQGDVYFKVRRAQHNLIRCRTQFALIDSMDEQVEAMARSVEAAG